MKYQTAKDWLYEQEAYALRYERLRDDFPDLNADGLNSVVKWLYAAFDAARNADREDVAL